MKSPYAIDTARLRLRPLMRTDFAILHWLFTHPDVRRYLFDGEIVSPDWTAAEITHSAARFVRHGYGLWGIRRRATDAFVGFCGYRPFFDPPALQLLYGIDPAWWAQGYATEAARAMIHYGFETLGFTEVVACTDVANEASARVMEKAGLHFRQRTHKDGLDLLYYALARTDFRPAPAKP